MSRAVSPPDPHRDGATPPPIPADLVPRHIAIVMDGNGRWARARGLPRGAGHRAGVKAIQQVAEAAVLLTLAATVA